ncbi:YkgJ family cysteine cluster protein, partial [Sandarakinorhabdus sp.]|uniref:YkgJ family cysteine cluster protein n=1 Tax=Sandarakinorhabdus sp. TaxID=1916663 RepID=UPI00333E276A
MSDKPFWETTGFAHMTRAQWESLCDGCGKCCVHKLEDEDTGEVFPTNVCCRLLNPKTAQCGDYRNRKALVP